MDSWIYIWLVLLVATLILEGVTVGLTSIWVSGGAFAALIVAFLHGPEWLQVTVFFVVTFILLFFTRPWAMKYFNNKRVRSNYEETIGKEVRVIERVDNHLETGKVIYNGMEWTARSFNDDETFEPDEYAIVENVVGVKLIIKRKEA